VARFTSSGGNGSGTPGPQGIAGADGADGDSAYQVALSNGFSGTEQEWLDSLVGADGADGVDGADGDPGPAGADGSNGTSFTFRGEWNDIDYYNVNDVVTFGGESYIAIQSSVVVYPPETTHWTKMVAKGADGEDGAQGDAGIGIPTGGTGGQILAKIDDTDYSTEWIDNWATYSGYTAVLKHEVKAGVALTKGQAVYVSSADGTNMVVSKASNASEQTSSKTMGLVEASVSNNGKVNVITEGLLTGLNTNGATAGDPVWLGTNGSLIYGLANKPVAPAHLVFIGIVTRVNSSNGEIFIRPQNGFELNEIHDVLIGSGYGSTPADNNILGYESASGLWKNKTASQLGLQTRVLNVSDTEIGYLANVTSDIQTQLNSKPDLLSPTITMASFASASETTDPVTISSANAHGGAGFAGLITLENTTSGATNNKKFIRMNTTGQLEIINNAYSNTIFSVTDGGDVSAAGKYNGATLGDTGWISVTSFNSGFSGQDVAYRRINQVVYLRGRLNGGTGGSGAFVLPSGFRPTVIEHVTPTQQYGTANLTYTSVGNDGNVVPQTSSTWLSNIAFPVG